MITTTAWIIPRATADEVAQATPATLRLEEIAVPEIGPDEVLVEPLVGCWEANMTHALTRQPIDVTIPLETDRAVLGNAGVVRVLQAGAAVAGFQEGDLGILFPCDCRGAPFGFPRRAMAFDAPGSMGILARRSKLLATHLIPMPQPTRFSIEQWAAFSARYSAAWINWQVALGSYRVLLSSEDHPHPTACGWGGGVAMAQMELAQRHGFRAALITSQERRRDYIRQRGVTPIDRTPFAGLDHDDARLAADPDYRDAYRAAEAAFLTAIRNFTGDERVAIFVDHIGGPVTPATLKALACPGVIATCGWKHGMRTSFSRPVECMKWHTHVHTHMARYEDGVAAVTYGEQEGWMPPPPDQVFAWEEVPLLAQRHLADDLATYFPLFRVNRE